MLLCQRLGQLAGGNETARDENLAQAAAFVTLERERSLQLCLGQELQLDEHPAERTPSLRLGDESWSWDALLDRPLNLDAVLPRQNPGERERRHVAVAHQDLSDQATTALLLGKRQV